MYHKPKISVIIPCYNSEKYLEKAVESVIKQTLEKIQIILVDDGSTDKTPELLQTYKMSDNRIEVVTHPKNLGLGSARNSGIEQANGEYIFFLDSDDYLHLNAFEVLYEKAVSENLDILEIRYVRHNGNQKEVLPKDLVLLPKPVKGLDYYLQGFFIEPSSCTKLWRTDFIKTNNLRFATGYYEDVAMVLDAFSIAERVSNTLFAPYHYISRPGSITNQRISAAHLQGYQSFLIQSQQLFLNPKLTKPTSSFPAMFFLFLKNLSVMALQSENNDLIKQTKVFVDEMTQKYRQFLSGNKMLSFPKRTLLQKSPFLYAKLKMKFKDL